MMPSVEGTMVPPPGLETVKSHRKLDAVADVTPPPGLRPPPGLENLSNLQSTIPPLEDLYKPREQDVHLQAFQNAYMLHMHAAAQMQAAAMSMSPWYPAWNHFARAATPAPRFSLPGQFSQSFEVYDKLEQYPVSHCSTTASLGETTSSESEDNESVACSDNATRNHARQIKVEQLGTENGESRVLVDWPVDASKFGGDLRQIISPSFEISPGVACKVMIHPSFVGDRKGQAGFKRAKGKGSIHLKCVANTSTHVPQVSFSVTIGTNGSWQPKRGPVACSFSDGAVSGLLRNEEWDFRGAVGKTAKICNVRLELAYS